MNNKKPATAIRVQIAATSQWRPKKFAVAATPPRQKSIPNAHSTISFRSSVFKERRSSAGKTFVISPHKPGGLQSR